MRGCNTMIPPKLTLIAALFSTIALHPAAPARADSCSNDYVTVETMRGTIIDIKPAPEPFPTADIYLSGPPACARIWMQVLKRDAAKCRVRGEVEVRGVDNSDDADNAWEIGSVNSE